MFRSADTAMFTAESRFITIPDLLYVSRLKKMNGRLRAESLMCTSMQRSVLSERICCFIIDEEEYLVSKGDFYIYNKERYTMSSRKIHRAFTVPVFHVLHFSASSRLHLPSDTSPSFTAPNILICWNSYSATCAESLAHQTAGSRETASHMLMTLLSLIFKTEHSAKRPPVRPHPHDELCINVKTFIHEHYLDDISLQTISNAVCISPY